MTKLECRQHLKEGEKNPSHPNPLSFIPSHPPHNTKTKKNPNNQNQNKTNKKHVRRCVGTQSIYARGGWQVKMVEK